MLSPMLDLGHYAGFVSKAPRIGIFTIGGGVPRNWAQQAPPFIDIMNDALGTEVRMNRFRYGVRICPEPVHFGGLSGCTYSEGVSWGKFVDPKDGGRFAEVLTDATIAWPILIRRPRALDEGREGRIAGVGARGYEPKWLRDSRDSSDGQSLATRWYPPVGHPTKFGHVLAAMSDPVGHYRPPAPPGVQPRAPNRARSMHRLRAAR
jgi:hypothetical protein